MNLSKGYYRFGTFDAKFRMSKNLGRMAIQNSIWGRCRIQKLESVGTKEKGQHTTDKHPSIVKKLPYKHVNNLKFRGEKRFE